MFDTEAQQLEAWPDGSFAVRLSHAIDRRGLGLQRLSAKLESEGISCSASTISLWRNGRTRPRRVEGKRAVRALQEILETPDGYLVEAEHVPVFGSTEWWSLSSSPREVLRHGEEFVAAQQAFGFAGPNDINRLAVMDSLSFDENRAFVGSTLTFLLEAMTDGVERMLLGTYSDLFSQDRRYLRIAEPRSGARLGRRRVSPATGQVMSELVFDFPLQRGDVTLLELEVIPVEGPEPALHRQMWHSMRASNPIGLIAITVDFHPDCIPSRAEQEFRTNLSDPARTETLREDLELMGPRVVGHGDALVDGGGLTVFWDWEDER